MLERDRHQPDHCLEYFPNPSFEEFCNYVAGPQAFRRLFMDNKAFEETLTLRNNIIMATLTVFLIPVFAHRKIYLLRNFTSRKSRVLWGLAFIFIPSNIVGAYFNTMSQRQLMGRYEINKDQFTRMLEVGDINITNPRQQWVDY